MTTSTDNLAKPTDGQTKGRLPRVKSSGKSHDRNFIKDNLDQLATQYDGELKIYKWGSKEIVTKRERERIRKRQTNTGGWETEIEIQTEIRWETSEDRSVQTWRISFVEGSVVDCWSIHLSFAHRKYVSCLASSLKIARNRFISFLTERSVSNVTNTQQLNFLSKQHIY